jgi:hypothetical protein
LDDNKAVLVSTQQQATLTVSDWQGRYKSLTQQHDQCRTQNASLYGLGVDLLGRYENKGFAEVFGAKEPFVQTARVTLENTKSQYEDKLNAALVVP